MFCFGSIVSWEKWFSGGGLLSLMFLYSCIVEDITENKTLGTDDIKKEINDSSAIPCTRQLKPDFSCLPLLH